jgi:hypothetical protein
MHLALALLIPRALPIDAQILNDSCKNYILRDVCFENKDFPPDDILSFAKHELQQHLNTLPPIQPQSHAKERHQSPATLSALTSPPRLPRNSTSPPQTEAIVLKEPSIALPSFDARFRIACTALNAHQQQCAQGGEQ